MEPGDESIPERVPMQPGVRPVELHADGLRHPRSTRFGGSVFTPYPDITHLGMGGLGLRLATRRGVFLLRRRAFHAPEGPERLARTLVDRIAALPDGEQRIARMRALDARATSEQGTPVTRTVLVLCFAVFAFQLLFAPVAELAGMFSTPLVAIGEFWRIATAHFLHGSLLHLVLNTICLLVLGALAERSLGSAATAVVLGVAGVGAMAASGLADYAWAVGASGLVAGLAGALLWLELRHPESLPAGWRIPRRVFIGAILAESTLLLLVPGIAHAAHAGGFVGGALVAALAGPEPQRSARLARGLAAARIGVVAVLALALLVFAKEVVQPGAAIFERRAAALLEIPEVPALVLNNEAWRIAVEAEASPAALDAATRLAERAVEETGRRDPNVLDTLAEVHFAAGRSEQALAVIDEAIALAPREPYFQEQRRRFRGERGAEDRPDPPRELPPTRPSPSLSPPEEPPGLRI